MNTNVYVSVIVPIYNVERFLAKCVLSLANQTLDEVEYIFVNDCTPDNSMSVLSGVFAQYPAFKEKSSIITHNLNKGLPSSRNSGLAIATGEYIFHCDGDDFVEPDMLKELYAEAKTCDADIVWCDWYLSFRKKERYMNQPSYSRPIEAVKSMMAGGMKYNVWNKLVRRSLYADNNVWFPDGYGMGEDLTMIKLFSFSNKISYIHKAYYHYVKTNMSSFSQTYSERHLCELKHNVEQIISFFTERYGEELKLHIEFFKLESKFPFLLSEDKSRKNLWKDWYPESNSFICLNKYISLRNRLIQFLASKNWWKLVSLYNSVFNRIVYSLWSR